MDTRPERSYGGGMARTDFRTPRLYLAHDLAEGRDATLTAEQANYLVNVLRLREGGRVLVFNGRDGEFAASLGPIARKGAALRVGERIRPQESPPDIDFLFAPLKHARLDYLAQKAVEMGARRLAPVMTRHTQTQRLNIDRLEANAIEACEQCGVIWVPEVSPPQPLERALAEWPAARLLIFCDEEAPQGSPLDALRAADAGGGAGFLVGPEGGFDEAERAMILKVPNVLRISLGPRILRADTAAVAALALIQSTIGDWKTSV